MIIDADLSILFSGLVFGLSAGLSPGPLLTLVISETLKHNAGAGVKIAISPLLTDAPIIFMVMFVLSRFQDIMPVIGMMSLCGAAFIAYLGYESFTFKGAELASENLPARSLQKGVIANFLNPSPYLFWFSIGGPLMAEALKRGMMPAALFLVPFYLLLVGSKVAVALAAGRSGAFLKSSHYVYAIRGLGLILFGYAALFLKDGLTRLGAV
jgi:threonine/homoserine/homoserine lactone efflux protein